MLSLVTLPNPTAVIASSSEWGNVFFSEFLPWGLVAIGIFIAFTLILWLVSTFKHGVSIMTHHKQYEDSSEGMYRKKHHQDIYD